MSFIRPLFIRFFSVCALACIGNDAHAEWRLFGSSEIASRDIQPFKKWTDVLARYPQQRSSMEALCAKAKRGQTCAVSAWIRDVESLRSLPRQTQIRRVNDLLNKKPYREDIVNWGIPDFWATPVEFQQKNGDCEDYAIAKYMSLRLLDFTTDNMRVVVLNDHNLGILHAVLAVREGSAIYLLDNQITQPTQDSRVFHYQPIYSINEAGWWRHQRHN